MMEQFQTPEQQAVTSLLEGLENRSHASRQDPDLLRRLNQHTTTGRAYTADCKDIIAALRKPAPHKLQPLFSHSSNKSRTSSSTVRSAQLESSEAYLQPHNPV